MGKFLSVRETFSRNMVRRVAEAKSVVAKPMMGDLGKKTAKIMRTGTKGVSAQFRDQTEYRGGSSDVWKRTEPFGTRKAPRKTMLGPTKKYRTAWLGGAGGFVKFTANQVTMGVDRAVFPQVKIHQSSAPFTLIKPKKKTKGGRDWKMRFFLGLTYGVWLTKARLERGLSVARRRISISNDVKREVAAMFGAETKKKLGIATQGIRRAA